MISGSSSAAAKSSTLPLPHQRPPVLNREQRDRERDGYYRFLLLSLILDDSKCLIQTLFLL